MAFVKKYKTKFDFRLFQQYKRQIQIYQEFSEKLWLKNKSFFFWVFNVTYIPKYSLLKLNSKGLRKTKVLRYARRTAPTLNLRLYSLYAAILKNGNAIRAKNLISKVIILLTENCIEKSGCKVLNSVLRFLEPAIGILKYRRGRNFYKMPIPLWPQRKKFLAAKFLVRGTRQRQRVYRNSFLLALYDEIRDVHDRKVDSFTLKIVKRYRKTVLKIENQSWRAKKRKF